MSMSRMHMWKGQERSLNEIAKMEGVDPERLHRRMLMGENLEQAVAETVERKRGPVTHWVIRYEGEEWTIPDLAAYLGVSKTGLYHRVRRARETGKDIEWNTVSKNRED